MDDLDRIFVMALSSPFGYISIICPIAMWFFLTKVTGIKYTEEQMVKSRGQKFIEYQKRHHLLFHYQSANLNCSFILM